MSIVSDARMVFIFAGFFLGGGGGRGLAALCARSVLYRDHQALRMVGFYLSRPIRSWDRVSFLGRQGPFSFFVLQTTCCPFFYFS
jgi:hypothetical protein